MPTTITRSPTTVVSDASPGAGSIPWLNPERAVASDDQRATASTHTSGTTRYLKATGFGFTIPLNATILGILVEIERARVISIGWVISVVDAVVRLAKGGVVSGGNKASSDNWPLVDTYRSYGGASDLWGETWTPADINAAGFGMFLAATITLPGGLANALIPAALVDHVRISVTYEAFSEPSILEGVVIGDAVVVEDLSAPSGAVGCILDFSHWLLGLPVGFLSSAAADFSYWWGGLPVAHFCTPLTLVPDSVVISDAVVVETGAVPPITPGGPTWSKLLIETPWAKQEVG